ncbi:cell division protein CrgA [Auraticoccus monumenti]|uniref:Cell division protein CrgA n=1 Tax=Auraticoccus monumenti TaxID=675864 RepID=A0A1G6SNX5_9ACTN|nr:Uncharacterised protein family (UPF0233) [Auraticoccus monumenti]
MPESKVRKSVTNRRRRERGSAAALKSPTSRRWVPPVFITVGLLGVAWLVTYYISSTTGSTVPLLTDLGDWNILIGMGLMASSFVIATLWR